MRRQATQIMVQLSEGPWLITSDGGWQPEPLEELRFAVKPRNFTA